MFWKAEKDDLREVFPVENLPVEVLGTVKRDALSLLYRNQDENRVHSGTPRISLKSVGKTPEKAAFLKKMLSILDGFDNVLRYAKIQKNDGDEVLDNWLKSLEGIHRRFLTILESEGLVVIETVGKPLDLTVHEVVESREVTGIRHNYVIEEITKGYKCGSRVLRDAHVVVAKNPDNVGVGIPALAYQDDAGSKTDGLPSFHEDGYENTDENTDEKPNR